MLAWSAPARGCASLPGVLVAMAVVAGRRCGAGSRAADPAPEPTSGAIPTRAPITPTTPRRHDLPSPVTASPELAEEDRPGRRRADPRPTRPVFRGPVLGGDISWPQCPRGWASRSVGRGSAPATGEGALRRDRADQRPRLLRQPLPGGPGRLGATTPAVDRGVRGGQLPRRAHGRPARHRRSLRRSARLGHWPTPATSRPGSTSARWSAPGCEPRSSGSTWSR